jgi:chemotaxis signal transduction protein
METLTQGLEPEQADGAGSRDALLVRIGREYVAVWLDAVVSQLDQLEIRPLPDWRAGVAGLIRVNDHFVPLYRPEEALGVARDDATVDRCALVVRSGDACVALAIDEALDVLAIAPASLRQPPAAIAEDGIVQALAWSGGVLVSVLDPRALVASCQAGATEASPVGSV